MGLDTSQLPEGGGGHIVAREGENSQFPGLGWEETFLQCPGLGGEETFLQLPVLGWGETFLQCPVLGGEETFLQLPNLESWAKNFQSISIFLRV